MEPTLYLFKVTVRVAEFGWEVMYIAAKSAKSAKNLARDAAWTPVTQWGTIDLVGRVMQDSVEEGLVASDQ